MEDELLQQLAASLRQGGAILRGKKMAARSNTHKLPDLSGQSATARERDANKTR